jgi:hypothetical protein
MAEENRIHEINVRTAPSAKALRGVFAEGVCLWAILPLENLSSGVIMEKMPKNQTA